MGGKCLIPWILKKKNHKHGKYIRFRNVLTNLKSELLCCSSLSNNKAKTYPSNSKTT